MNTLYIDVTRLYNNQRLNKTMTGVDRVGLAYMKRFADVGCAVIRLPKYWLFFSKTESADIFERLLNNVPIVLPKKWTRFLYKTPKPNSFLLNTSHSGLENAEFLLKMQGFGLQGIYFLHDLIPIEYPEYCREGECDRHIQRLLTMSKAALIIANSKDVKNKFECYCQTKNLNCPKIIYAHLGADGGYEKKSDQQLDEELELRIGGKPFFLMLGTIEARKNHLLILMVWRMLLEKLGENCPKLVIVGKRGWESEQVFDVLDRSIELKDCIIELNNCSDVQIVSLLTKARALLFPSHTEGFGLPLIEALKARTPVIASDIEIFCETGFGVIKLLNPNNSQIWCETILQYLNESKWAEQVASIVAIQDLLPTWERHFDVVYPQILSVIDY